jgi:hypothetical protein
MSLRERISMVTCYALVFVALPALMFFPEHALGWLR